MILLRQTENRNEESHHQKIQNRTSIRPTINVVTQGDNGVVRTRRDEINERSQRIETTMNVTDHEMSLQEDRPLYISQNTAHWLK